MSVSKFVVSGYILSVRPNEMFRDFGRIIQGHVTKGGFEVVRSYCGHGIGELFHCAPNVPHYASMIYIHILCMLFPK